MSEAINIFSKGMNLDSVPSLQPDGTYRVAVNAQHETFDHNSYGLFNEPSNELCFAIPKGYDICGWGFIEERDQFVIFSHNAEKNISQIGIGDTKTCTYKIVLEDKDSERFLNKFCFSQSERINPTFKHLRPCNNLWMYWSNNFTYYRLNLDADLCDIKYEDLVLFDCKCPAVIKASPINENGELLDVGAYQFVCQLIDDDENKTNWFSISNPITLTSPDNKIGDKSDEAVIITIDKLPKSYPKLALAVIKTVGGVQTAEVFTKLYHNGNKISYIYRGKDRDDEPIEISEILARKTGYIQGKDLVQKDGRLFLYNLKEEWNLDAQKYVNDIKANFTVCKLPSEQAKDFPTLPRGEVISIAAVFNYCDGTSSVGFHIHGRAGSKDDFTIIPPTDDDNCTDCNKYKWEIENTAFIEEDYCPSGAFSVKAFEDIATEKFNSETVIYKKIDKSRFEFCKNEIDPNIPEDQLLTPCHDFRNVGVECDECQQYKAIPAAEIVTGKLICPNEEDCVDGYCPTTGKPCRLCNTCATDGDMFLELHIGSHYDHNEVDLLEADFDSCPNGEPIYDDEGCRVIGYKPAKIAKGKFGYWQSTELYPKTKGCDGEYLYGELAGTPIRHHLVPDENLVTFATSRVNGVVGKNNVDNFEWKKTDVFIIGLEVCGIKLPPNPPKPYCPNNPVSIYWQKVDPIDRRVNARGLLTHTFLGNIRNKQYAVPKNAVNSLEYFDRHLETTYNGILKYRGGQNINAPIYNFHSPDTHYSKIPLTADRAYIPYEVYGTGERYGIWAEGEEPLNMWHTTINHRGARQAINLNHFAETGDTRIITKPPSCDKQVITHIDINACDPDDITFCIFIDNVPASNIESFKIEFFGAFGGNGQSEWSGTKVAKLCGRLEDSTTKLSYDIDYTINVNGQICRYHITDLVRFSRDGKGSLPCKFTKEYNTYSIDYKPPEYKNTGGSRRCVKGISYADTDSIVDKGNNFTYSLLNLKREKSVYLELEGSQLTLNNSIDKYLTDSKYNSKNGSADGTSDGSFFGDVRCENCPILNAAGHHAILLNDSPNQYGRIESAAYIPLGFDLTAEEVICGKADRYGIGDSYVGLHSFRRYSYVTDKIGSISEQYPPEIDRLGGDILFGLIDLGVAVDRLLCRHDCSKLPPTCDLYEIDGGDSYYDERKKINLRDESEGFQSCWPETKPPFQGQTGRDTYHGNTQNTLIHFWTESRINLWKLTSGESDYYKFEFDKNYPTSKPAEVYYPRLKKYALDSAVPEGTPWTQAWLNRIGIKWQTIALLKRICITVVKLLIVLGITLIIATMLGGGLFGGIAAAVVLGFLLFNDDLNLRLCRWLYSLFNVRQCKPKCLDGENNCYIVDNDALPFEENYYKYNWDFNTQNDLETKIGMTDPYDTCICELGEGNQIVYSQKQNPLSITDAYKNFLVNSYLNIPADFGKVQTLFSLHNNFYAHTSDMIINIATSDGILDLGNGQALEIITNGGDLRTNPKEMFSDIPEGYGGTIDPNSAINTQYGRFFVDRKSKKVFLFGRGGLTEISNFGIRNFLKEHLDLELHKQFPNYKNVDEVAGVGYKMAFDHRFNKLIFTKIDYKAKHPETLTLHNDEGFRLKSNGLAVNLTDTTHFEDISFTLSFDPNEKAWISFHTYFPDGYGYDRDHFYSIKDGEFWKHGDKYGDFQTFFGDYHPHVIEYVSKQPNMLSTTFKYLEMEVEASEFDGKGWIHGREDTFAQGMFYNDTNNSGIVDFVRKDSNNSIANMKQKDNEVTLDWQNDNARINEIRNRNTDENSAMFDKTGTDGLGILNEQLINGRGERLEGKYLIARLYLDHPEKPNLQHLTKRIITSQEQSTK